MVPELNERVHIGQNKLRNQAWHEESDTVGANKKVRKRFIICKCPKCSIRHDVYMLWAGRGTPRKYCVSCRSIVSVYDEAVFFEASTASRKHQGRKHPVTPSINLD